MTPTGHLRIQVTTSAGWGGRESLPLAIHRHWSDRGTPSLLLAGDNTPLADRGRDEVQPIPRGRLGSARAVRSTLTAGGRRDFVSSVLISHFTHDLGALRWALRGADNLPLIAIKHVSPGSPKTDWVHRWIYRRVNRLLCVSEFVAQKCRAAYPMSPGRIAVWYPGVDESVFGFDEAARGRIRARHGATHDHVVVGYVGRVTPNKGLEWLLEAFLGLTAAIDQTVLWIVGGASDDEREYEENLQQQVSAHRHGHRVTFTGYQNAVHEYLSALDIFVTPSCEESFGLTTVEAMLSARPVVGFNAAGTAEIVVDGQTGSLVDPAGDRVTGLREAIARLLINRALASTMGREGHSRALDLFSLGAMMNRLDQHIEAVTASL